MIKTLTIVMLVSLVPPTPVKKPVLRSPKDAEQQTVRMAVAPKPFSVNLVWSDSDPMAVKFRIAYGRSPSSLTNTLLCYDKYVTVSNLIGKPWFFQVYAQNVYGTESDPSDRLLRYPPTNLLFVASAKSNFTFSSSLKGPWKETNSPLALLNPKGQQWFRGYGASNYTERW